MQPPIRSDPIRSGSWIKSKQCYQLEQTMCNIAIMIKNAKTVFCGYFALFLSTCLHRKWKQRPSIRWCMYTWYGRMLVIMHTCWEHNTGIRNEYTVAYLSMHENLNSVNSHRRPKQISCGSMNSIEIAREYATLLHTKCIASNALKPIYWLLLLLLSMLVPFLLAIYYYRPSTIRFNND